MKCKMFIRLKIVESNLQNGKIQVTNTVAIPIVYTKLTSIIFPGVTLTQHRGWPVHLNDSPLIQSLS